MVEDILQSAASGAGKLQQKKNLKDSQQKGGGDWHEHHAQTFRIQFHFKSFVVYTYNFLGSQSALGTGEYKATHYNLFGWVTYNKQILIL